MGLGKVGQKSASIAVLGLTSVKSVLAAPAKALEFIVTPGNNFDPEQCQHDIITSPYVNLDESCSPTTDFTEGIDALLDSSVDEIIQHCKDYPVVCDVLKKNLPLTGPQRWQIKKCNKNDIGELIGYEAEQRDKRDVKLNWSVTSEAPGGAMTVYSLSKTSSSNIPNSAWKALLGESGEPIKIRLSKTPIMSMKRKRYQALALNDSKLYYQLDPNKLLEEGSSIFDWNKLKEGSRAYKAALATTQMRLNKLSHTNLKSCCLNYTDECKDYGFVSPGNSNSIRENKSNKKVQ